MIHMGSHKAHCDHCGLSVLCADIWHRGARMLVCAVCLRELARGVEMAAQRVQERAGAA